MPADFSSLALSPALLSVVRELGFEAMTPIQAESIPALLAGRDLIGQSKTGSGKTLAFALPLLARLDPGRRALQALVLCPTRELCAQVARELRRLGRQLGGLTVVSLAGGQELREQARKLQAGLHVAVGTPGRLCDHLRRRNLDLTQVAMVVLDEADRMLDLGFGEDVIRLLQALPLERQTVFFSATYPPNIRELSARYQREPQRVTIVEPDDAEPATKQLVAHVDSEQKLAALRGALALYGPETALVFANLKATVAELAEHLRALGVGASALHGDLEQHERERELAKFRNGSTRVLVASDVAARGIDLERLDLVVNFDLPSPPEVYVHRIGRTGRAGRAGLALSLCSPAEAPRLAAIELYTGSPLTRIEPSALGGAEAAGTAPAKMLTVRLSGGRKDKLRPSDILGALTGEAAGLAGADVGKIEIFERFSYVAVERSLAPLAVSRLNRGRIKGKRFKAELVK